MNALTAAVLAIWAWVTLFWLWSLARKDAGVMDLGWGPGFMVALAALALASDGLTPRAWLLLALVSVWAVRLSSHLWMRNRGRGEDPRYRRWREQAGASFWWRSYGKVFLLQGLVMAVLAAPLGLLLLRPGPTAWGPLDLLAVLLWLAGFLFESIADAQLLRFQRAGFPRGAVLDRGLWAWSRHPNYFGEAVLWWGYGILCMAGGLGVWALLGPGLMTWLLLRVSGVRLLEEHMKERRPAYRQYVARTSAFLPRPPRKAS